MHSLIVLVLFVCIFCDRLFSLRTLRFRNFLREKTPGSVVLSYHNSNADYSHFQCVCHTCDPCRNSLILKCLLHCMIQRYVWCAHNCILSHCMQWLPTHSTLMSHNCWSYCIVSYSDNTVVCYMMLLALYSTEKFHLLTVPHTVYCCIGPISYCNCCAHMYQFWTGYILLHAYDTVQYHMQFH